MMTVYGLKKKKEMFLNIKGGKGPYEIQFTNTNSTLRKKILLTKTFKDKDYNMSWNCVVENIPSYKLSHIWDSSGDDVRFL